MRKNGTTGLLQDFLVIQYQKTVNDFMSVDEHGQPEGDGLIEFLHAEFADVVDHETSVEEKLETLRKTVDRVIEELNGLRAGLEEVPQQIQRIIASERMGHSIAQAMPDEEPAAKPKSSGIAPL